jgi:hypothetical protein
MHPMAQRDWLLSSFVVFGGRVAFSRSGLFEAVA